MRGYTPSTLRELAEIVRGERPNPAEMYDHDLKVHEVTLKACGYDDFYVYP